MEEEIHTKDGCLHRFTDLRLQDIMSPDLLDYMSIRERYSLRGKPFPKRLHARNEKSYLYELVENKKNRLQWNHTLQLLFVGSSIAEGISPPTDIYIYRRMDENIDTHLTVWLDMEQAHRDKMKTFQTVKELYDMML